MKSRNQFPFWLTSNCYFNIAEVGVFKGEFSEHILNNWNGTMVLVDSWCRLESYDDIINNLNNQDQENNYQKVLQMTGKYYGRTQIVRNLSSEASKLFPDYHFDVVYLDADHSYNGLTSDLKHWIKKIKKGGAISGHDYIDGHIHFGNFGVKSALKDFFGKEPNLITNEPFPTWIYYL